MRRRETLIGIRNQRQHDPALAAERVGTVKFAWYAKDPSISRCVSPLGSTPSAKWVREHTFDQDVIEVTHALNARDLALAGVARAVLPVFVGAQEPGLQRVSDPIETLSHDQWLVSHQDDRHIPEIRQILYRIGLILRANNSLF